MCAFAEIVDDALEGETHRFDRTVLTVLRTTADPADPVGPPWLEITFRDLTALIGYPVITSRVYLGVHWPTDVPARGASEPRGRWYVGSSHVLPSGSDDFEHRADQRII